jgi:hypothetical protein
VWWKRGSGDNNRRWWHRQGGRAVSVCAASAWSSARIKAPIILVGAAARVSQVLLQELRRAEKRFAGAGRKALQGLPALSNGPHVRSVQKSARPLVSRASMASLAGRLPCRAACRSRWPGGSGTRRRRGRLPHVVTMIGMVIP